MPKSALPAAMSRMVSDVDVGVSMRRSMPASR